MPQRSRRQIDAAGGSDSASAGYADRPRISLLQGSTAGSFEAREGGGSDRAVHPLDGFDGSAVGPLSTRRTVSLINTLKERRLPQIVGAYAAGGWLVLQLVDQLADRGIIPELSYRVALTLFLCLIPGAFIVAWFHGAKGDQKAPAMERWLLAGVLLIGLGTSGFVLRNGLQTGPLTGAEALAQLSPTEDPRRIAVLYFEGRGSEDANLIATGLTETLIDELSGIDVLTVISRNGVGQFRGESVTPDSVGRTLEVGTVVDGVVTEAGDVIRVDVELVRAASGEQINATQLERPRGQLFELQDEIANQVAFFLREELGQEVQVIQRRATTRDVEAWALFQRAAEAAEDAEQLAAVNDMDASNRQFEVADSMYALAEAEDASWAEPVTRRGWIIYRRIRLGGYDRDIAELVEAGRERAARALAIAPDDPDALELRGMLQYWPWIINLTSEPGESERLFEGAERDLRASIAANPRQASALNILSQLLINKGETAQAKLVAQRSYEADPYLQDANRTIYRVFWTSLDLQDRIEATQWCELGGTRFPEDSRFVECQLWLYALPDLEPEAVQAAIPELWALRERMVELSPPEFKEWDESASHLLVAMALVRANLPDSARSVAVAVRPSTEIDPLHELAYYEAIIRTWLGDYDEAIEELGLFLSANPGRVDQGEDDEGWWLADLVTDPRYQTLMGR